MRRWLAALLLAWSLAVPAADLPPTVLTALEQAHIPLANVAIEVREVNARSPLLAINAEKSMNPASVIKLLTTYAALDLLGPAYTWKTEAWRTGELDVDGVLHGDLILKGSGDPNFSEEQFWLWLRELRQRGLREIRGDLVLDRSAFDLPPFDSAAFDNDPLRPYNAGADALVVNGGVQRLRLLPEGKAVRVLVEPPLGGLALDNRLRLSSRSVCPANWDDAILPQVTANRLTLSGDYPAACNERNLYLNPLPHREYVYGLFRSLWLELGGTLSGSLRDGGTPPSAVLLSSHESAPLAEQIRATNKFSNNLMARQLYLTLGRRADAPATPERSRAAIDSWLKSRQADFSELVLENGCGLSRRERISARHLADLLQWANTSRFQPEFESSLAIVGLDGTMRRRYRERDYAGHAHLKSGSLDEARALAGYLQSRSGRLWLLAVMVNQPGAAAAQPAFDALLDWLYQQ